MHSPIESITELSCLTMEFKVITFSILLCLYKIELCGTNAVQSDSNQRQIQRPPIIRGFAAERVNGFGKQLNIRPNLNEQRIFHQNNEPVNRYQPLNVDRNRPLTIRGDTQISNFRNVQKPNIRPNNGGNSQITQNRYIPQAQVEKQGFQSTRLANENRYLKANFPNPSVSEEYRRRFINTKKTTLSVIHPIISEVKKPSAIKVHEEGPIKQEYTKKILTLPNNQKNVAQLRYEEKSIGRRNIPIQQPGASKRYKLIRRNGDVEYYDELETILKKYPHIKLPQNLQLIPSKNHVGKTEFKAPENMGPLQVTKPHTKMNIPYSPNHNIQPNDVPIPNQLKHSINNFQNSNKISYDTQAQRRSTLPAIIKIPTNFLPEKVKIDQTSKKPFVSEPVLNKTTVFHPKGEQSDKIKHLINEVANSIANLTIDRKEDIRLNENVANKAKVANTSELDHGDLSDQTSRVEQNSATRFPSSKAYGYKNINKPLNKATSLNDTFEKPLNYPVVPKIISNVQKDKTLGASPTIGLGQPESPLLPEEESNKTRNLNAATKFLSLSNQKTLKEQFESNHVKNLNNSSIPENITRVTASNLNNSVLSKKAEKNGIITDQPMLGNRYVDNNKDLLSLLEPVTWFTTNDPYFWNKLVNDDDNSFVYIINVESHPKIERDTKTTIHANGTIVEEITETTWVDNDDNPTVTKTVKVTPADDKNLNQVDFVPEH